MPFCRPSIVFWLSYSSWLWNHQDLFHTWLDNSIDPFLLPVPPEFQFIHLIWLLIAILHNYSSWFFLWDELFLLFLDHCPFRISILHIFLGCSSRTAWQHRFRCSWGCLQKVKMIFYSGKHDWYLWRSCTGGRS